MTDFTRIPPAIRDRLRALRRRTMRQRLSMRAVLGDGFGNWIVTQKIDGLDRPTGEVWVRFFAGQDDDGNALYSTATKAIGGEGGAFFEYHDAPIRVAFNDEGKLYVKGVDAAGAKAAGLDPRILNPGNKQSAWYYIRNLANFKGMTPGASLVVTARTLIYDDNYGALNKFTGTGRLADKLDISSFVPAADLHRVVVVFLDTVNNEIYAVGSTAQATSSELDFTDYQECFTQRRAESVPNQAWVLQNNQSSISMLDAGEDMRQLINVPFKLGFPNPTAINQIIRSGQTATVHGTLTVTGTLTVKGLLKIRDEKENIQKNEITAARVNSDVDNTQTQIFEEDGTNLITAAGGITPTRTHYAIAGNGGPIIVTASPPIAAGVGGQLLILEGEDDTNTVTLTSSTGLHLHGGSWVGGATDILGLLYDDTENEYHELFRNNPKTEKGWNFASPAGTSGTFYEAGFYDFSGTNNDFSGGVNWGTANAPYAAHFFVVTGEATVDELTIRVTGTSITDAGVRTAADTDDIVIPNGTAANSYFESKKFIGQVAISVVSGTAKQCNYGWAKYWDNGNTDFKVVGLEALFTGGANDANANLLLLHHKTTGWTYNAGADPTPPTQIADMQTDYVTEYQIKDGENGAWKRTNLTTVVEGSGSEGLIIQIVTTANRTFEPGLNTFQISVVPR